MTATDKLFEIVKRKGPVIPSDVSKDINQNLLFTSAMLSELKSRNLLKISHLKIGGGSPLYYTPEQEKDLVRFIKFLDEKDQRAVGALQEHKILRDTQLTPLIRVSLRQVKDFAIPLEVTFGESTEIFWKWYQTPNQEASDLINKIINSIPKQVDEPAPIPKHLIKDKAEESITKEKPKVKKQVKQKEQKQKEPRVTKKNVVKKESIEEELQETLTKEKTKPIKQKKIPITKKSTGEFYDKILNYFELNNINVLSEKTIRKSREYEFSLAVPSRVGPVEFICIAKKKKSISEGDLSTLYVNAQSHNKPILIVTDGTLAKKAEEMLNKQMKGLNIVNI